MKTAAVLPQMSFLYLLRCLAARRSKGGMSAVLACLLLLGLTVPVSAKPWFNTDWSFRQEIAVSSDLSDETLDNYPLLVHIDDPDALLFDLITDADDHSDLRFVDDDNDSLAYEMEEFDADEGVLRAWVRVPEVLSAGSSIYLYYGNPGSVSTTEDAEEVWDDHELVMHLEDAEVDAGGRYSFATDGVADAAGQVGGAQEFQQDSSYIDVDDPIVDSDWETFTFEAWIRPDDASHPIFPRLLNISRVAEPGVTIDDVGDWLIAVVLNRGGDQSPGISYVVNTNEGLQQGALQFADLDDDNWPEWYYVALRLNLGADEITAFVDAASDTAAVSGDSLSDDPEVVGDDTGIRIGNFLDLDQGERPFRGLMDELRFSQALRSDAWLRANYRTQNPDEYDDYVDIGPLEAAPDTKLWLGEVDSDWFEPGNWTPAGVPESSDAVIISSSAERDAVINDSQQALAGSITIEAGAELTMESGAGIEVSGDWTNNGAFNAGVGSSVTMDDDGVITTGGEDNAFYNLDVTEEPTIGVSAADDLYVTNDFTSASTYFDAGRTTTVGGNTDLSGGLATSTGTFVFNGDTELVLRSGDSFFNIEVTGALSLESAIRVRGDFEVSGGGSFDGGTHTVEFSGTAAQTISFADSTLATVTATKSGGSLTFEDGFSAETFTVGADKGFDLSFNAAAGGQSTAVSNAVVLDNTGTLLLGNDADDGMTFSGGVQATAPSGITVGGTVATGGAAGEDIELGDGDTGVVLSADAVFEAGAGDIILGGTVDGDAEANARELRLNSTGEATLGGAVGGGEALGGLSTNAGGATELGGDVTTVGEISFANLVELTAAAVAVSSGGNAISFAAAIESGGNALSLDAGAGGTIAAESFAGEGNLTIENSSSTTFSAAVDAGVITLSDTQTAIRFEGSVEASELVTAGAGYDVLLLETVEITGGPTEFLNTGVVTLGDEQADVLLFAGGLETAGNATNPARTDLGGQLRTAAGPVVLGELELTAESVVDTTDDGGSPLGANVEFSSTVDGAHGLAVSAGDGEITFASPVGGVTALSALTANSVVSGAAALDVTVDGPVVVNADVSLTGTATIIVRAAELELGTGADVSTVNEEITFEIDGLALGGSNSIDAGAATFTIYPRTAAFTVELGPAATLGADVHYDSGFAGITAGLFRVGDAGHEGAITLTGAPLEAPYDLEVATGAAADVTVAAAEYDSRGAPGGGGDLTLSAGAVVNLETETIDLGSGAFAVENTPAVLGANVSVTAGGGIAFDETVDGAQNLSLNAGSGGAISAGGAIGSGTPLSTLTVVDSNGTTFADELNAETLVIADTQAGQTVTVAGALDLTSGLEVSGTANAYNVALNAGAGGQESQIAGATQFANTGTVTLGADENDEMTFSGGVQATAPSGITVGGTIGTAGGAGEDIVLGDGDTDVTLAENTVLDTGAGAGSVTLGGAVDADSADEQGLEVTAGEGLISIAGPIGAAERLRYLRLDSTAQGFDLPELSVAEELRVFAGDEVSQQGPLSGQTLQVKTRADGGAAITLPEENNDFDAVVLEARNGADTADAAGEVSYRDAGGFDLGDLGTDGAGVRTSAGIILHSTDTVSQSGGVRGATLDLRGSGPYELDGGGNRVASVTADITGGLALSNEDQPIELGELTVGGDLDIRADGVADTGAVTVGGSAAFDGRGAGVVLEGAGADANEFDGPVTLSDGATGITLANNTFAGTVTISGDATVLSAGSANQVFGELIIDTSVTLGADLRITGDLVIEAAAVLDTGAGSHRIALEGDWRNLGGVFEPQEGTVVFFGSEDIEVLGENAFYRFVAVIDAGEVAGVEAGDEIEPGITISFEGGSEQTFRSGGRFIVHGDGSDWDPPDTAFEPLPDPTHGAIVLESTAGAYWILRLEGDAQLDFRYVYIHQSEADPALLTPELAYATDLTTGWLVTLEIISARTVDRSGTGKIDAIRLTANDDVPGDLPGFEVTVRGYRVAADRFSAGPQPEQIDINLIEGDELDTGARPLWRLVDPSGNELLPADPPNIVTVGGLAYHRPEDGAAPVIGYTLALAGGTEVFIHFSEPVRDAGDAVLTDSNFGYDGSAGIASVARVGDDAGGHPTHGQEYIITLTEPVTAQEIIDGELITTSDIRDLAGLELGDSSDVDDPVTDRSTHRVSDLGLGPPGSALIEPVFAVNPVSAAAADPDRGGLGTVREFDGSEFLERGEITLQAFRSDQISADPQLIWDAEIPAQFVREGVWLPEYDEREFSGLAPRPRAEGPEAADGPTVVNANLLEYGFSDLGVADRSDIEFWFELDDAGNPLYFGRLESPHSSRWYRSVRPWKFNYRDVRSQRGGVTIHNNVINPERGERAELHYELDSSGMVTINVFNLAGDLVDQLYRGRRSAGEYSTAWDGRNRGGHAVARGIYFIRVVAPGIDEYRKVMVVK